MDRLFLTKTPEVASLQAIRSLLEKQDRYITLYTAGQVSQVNFESSLDPDHKRKTAHPLLPTAAIGPLKWTEQIDGILKCFDKVKPSIAMVGFVIVARVLGLDLWICDKETRIFKQASVRSMGSPFLKTKIPPRCPQSGKDELANAKAEALKYMKVEGGNVIARLTI